MEEHLLPSVSYNAVQSHTPPRNHRRLTRRSRSAPSLFTCTQSIPPCLAIDDSHRTPSIVRIASIGAALYITLGVIVYIVKRDSFSGHRTCSLVDALYFSVVTLCTIGYGDIVPRTPLTKLFVCAFVLVGFGFIDVLLDGLVRHVLERQEAVLLSAVDGGERSNVVLRTYVMDVEKRRMRIRMKVGCALCVVVGCVASGTVAAHVLEGLDWLESFYLSVTSVTTVGYGDYSFMTVRGRAFATAWLLVSTLAVAQAFLYLTELRIERRNRRIAEWVMKKKMTVGDLVAADLDSDGSISKSEYVIYKLKEMGKIAEKDILQICEQFDRFLYQDPCSFSVFNLMPNFFCISSQEKKLYQSSSKVYGELGVRIESGLALISPMCIELHNHCWIHILFYWSQLLDKIWISKYHQYLIRE